MPTTSKTVVSKFPLRLMPSVRRIAEEFSQKEGVSLNQFINVAVAEKLAHMQHHEWLALKPVATAASLARGLAILDRPTGNAPDPGDELPIGYETVRKSNKYRRLATGRPLVARTKSSGKTTTVSK